MTVAFSADELYLAHQPPGGAPHPERPARLAAILDRLEAAGLLARMERLPQRDASDEELLAVHDRAVLETVEAHHAAGGGWIDADTFVGESSPAAARRAAGAALAATGAVLGGSARSAFVAARPPGHHATRDRSMGFCLYNQVAVAAADALARGVERVAVVDWDLHHGNGTQAIFDADPRVLYVSTHAYPYYPGTGAVGERGSGEAAGTKINIPLPHGAGDRAFLAAYEQVAVPALEAFEPQLLLALLRLGLARPRSARRARRLDRGLHGGRAADHRRRRAALRRPPRRRPRGRLRRARARLLRAGALRAAAR